MIIACAGCHLHWLAVVLLPVALWVFKIFRHKGKKCPCDCHEHISKEDIKESDEIVKNCNDFHTLKNKKHLTEGYQPKGNTPAPKEVPNFQQGYKPTIITEGKVKRGGVNPMPTCPKPPAKPFGQK